MSEKKSWYKRWWAITLFIFIILGVIGGLLGNSETTSETQTKSKTVSEEKEQLNPTKTPTSDSKNSGILKDLEELKEKTDAYRKVDECADTCSENSKIPAVRDQFYMACYQIYYNAGLEELEKYMATCNK